MYRYRWWMAVIGGGALGVLGIFIWQTTQPKSLLPNDIVQKVDGFTPYFYKNMPAGYTTDVKRIVYENGVLMVPLTKDGGSPIVVTEQAIPAKFSTQDLQQNSDVVDGTASPATLNNIEGRFVGTMVAQHDHTLILVSATSNEEAVKSDVTSLLRGLRPVR